MRWDLLLIRKSKNRLNPDITRRKLKKVAEAASRNRTLGFEAKVGKLEDPVLVIDEATKEEVHCYRVRIRLIKESVRNQNTVDEKFQHVLRVLTRCANSEGWSVSVDTPHQGLVKQEKGEGEVVVSPEPIRLPFKPPALTKEVFGTFFAGVYERDAHIRTIHDALRACVDSHGEILSHVLLYGLPGAAKTVMCKRFKSWYEQDLPEDAAQRVLFTNNISTTKAGLENMLLGLAEEKALPYLLIMDEIEKQPLENLLCLNTVMSEGVITKLNARVGHRREEAKFTVVGICNDETKLRSFQNGHMWSRFTHKLRCVRPSKELCRHILREEVTKIPEASPEWADAALEFGWEKMRQRDIREIKGHLDGRERLLDGSWQKDQLAIRDAEKKEDALLQSSSSEQKA